MSLFAALTTGRCTLFHDRILRPHFPYTPHPPPSHRWPAQVINFDFPHSGVSYVHRIGRTGRAGRRGRAITFFTDQDMPMLRTIANVMKLSGCDVPKWMLQVRANPSIHP